MQRGVSSGLPRYCWITLIALILFRAATYALTSFSAGGDGFGYMKKAAFIGTQGILPPLSVQPNAYGFLLSWFQVHRDPVIALDRIGRTQQMLDLLIVLALCWIAMKLLGRSKPFILVGAWSLIMLQPFTGIWNRTIYSEPAVSFFSFTGYLALSIFIFRSHDKFITLIGIFLAGLMLGLASVLRSDVLVLNAVLLIGIAVYSIFFAGSWLRWRRAKVLALLLSCVAVPLVMSSYQYISSGEFGIFNNKRIHEGYFGWIRTWPASPKEYEVFAFMSQRDLWVPSNFPAKAFDSKEEAGTVAEIIERWRYHYKFASAPEIDKRFEQLVDEKIKKNPLRHYVLNPIRRIFYFWINLDGSQYYAIPYALQRPVSTLTVGLIFFVRLLLIALFMAGCLRFFIKLKRNGWSFQPENWLSLFCFVSCLFVLFRTLELGILSTFMIAGLMELRFISIVMPFFIVGALFGARWFALK